MSILEHFMYAYEQNYICLSSRGCFLDKSAGERVQEESSPVGYLNHVDFTQDITVESLSPG